MSITSGTGVGSLPRIIAIGRHPLERAYSSYRYNYVVPTVAEMRRGRFRHIEAGRIDDQYYKSFLFSFEDMLRAELKVLQSCLAPDSAAVRLARQRWSNRSCFSAEYRRRAVNNLEQLVDLDGFCYEKAANPTFLRSQWTELFQGHPQKVISNVNVHLTQSMIGRSLYVLPLEWWYAIFRRTDIFFMCTEDLSDPSGQSITDLVEFLGLPSHNFSKIVSAGAYNVGGHQGYDTEVSWDMVHNESDDRVLPISEKLRNELLDFFRPFNERLFQLTGRICHWG
jgi:hypothetical protein